MTRLLVILLLGICLTSDPAHAHPIHTTMTQVTVSRVSGGYAVELRIRAFVDDFSAAVAAARGQPPPTDSSFNVQDAQAYLQDKVRLFDGRASVRLEWCGMRRDGEVVWLCLKAASPARGRAFTMSNRLHMSLYADQVNLVKVTRDGRSRSHLFTARDGARTIG